MINESFKKYLPRPIIDLFRYFYNGLIPLAYYLKRQTKLHAYAGIPLHVYIFDQISKVWYDLDWTRNEIGFLRLGKLKDGATVFDIGAHYGVVALIFSKIVGIDGQVIAVEMDSHNIAIAKINKNINNASNLSIVHAAVAEKNGIISFIDDKIKNEADINVGKKVHSITVDKMTQKYGPPSVLYIDVEGYECQVLRGSKKTLQYFPDCCIEVHVNHGLDIFGGSIKEIISYFPQNHYDLYMAKATDKCIFKRFSFNSNLIKNRFYLVMLNKDKHN